MPKFAYQALDAQGKKVRGELDARSRADAFTQLSRLKLQPVSVRLPEEGNSASDSAAPQEQIKLTQAQIIFFSDEVSTLIDSGLQLEGALKVLEDMDEHANLKKVSYLTRQKLREGSTFSNALRSSSPSFGELYCTLISAGEIGGMVSQIMRRQCEYMTAMQELRGKIIQSLIYPSFIFASGVVVIIIFVTFLIPQLRVLLDKTGKKLSLPAEILLGASTFAEHYALLILILLGLAGTAFYFYIRSEAGRHWWHRFQLNIPLIGPILSSRFYAQFSNTLANLIANGVPLLSAMQLLRKASTNVYFYQQLGRVSEDLSEGSALSRAMTKANCFPGTMVDLVKVGEQTGELDRSLAKVGLRYERDMLRRIQRLTAIIQPTILVILAVVVGGVVIAIVTSIFEAVAGLRMH